MYRVSHGQQIVSSYQPKVANPRTGNQQRQRAKFNLMTKLNAITPAILLRPFSPTAGIARPMFSKSLMKYIEVDSVASLVGEETYQARIAATNIHFGEGSTLMPEGVVLGNNVTVTALGTGVQITIVDPSIFDGDIIALRVIDVCRTVGEGGQYIDVRYFDFTEDGSATKEFVGEGMQHRIYFQFIVRRSSSTSLRTGVLTDEGEDGSELIADSSQLVNSASVVGSSIYYNSYWVPAGE